MKLLIILQKIIWGAPALLLILGVGIYISVCTGFAQLRLFPAACRFFLKSLRGETSENYCISPFRAMCTALAATVGTGNLVGVAGAICLGGPGAVFWMWLCGFLGMATKYAEVALAVRYRVTDCGEFLGGPMYTISHGMGERWTWLGKLYCVFAVIASFGIGNAAQINAVITGINDVLQQFGILETSHRNISLALILTVMIGTMLIGGAKRIADVSQYLVPFASVGYIVLCVGVIACRRDYILDAFRSIIIGAFSPGAVTGGIIGASFRALSVGCSRGVFTNEAGMGTASIAHAAAEVDHPVQQGLMGIMEVFLDTIVICTLTALVILVSGVPAPFGNDVGSTLTISAFTSIYGGWASIAVASIICSLAFATVLGWGLYGARCAQYLFGNRAWEIFALLQTIAVFFGAVLNTTSVWLFAETANGLMVIPNLITLTVLTPEVARLTKEYRKSGGMTVSGGNYADFHQRKPL